MSERNVPLMAIMATLASALPVTGCTDDPAKSACLIEPHEMKRANGATATGSLFLSNDARLDAVADGFVLFGATGNTVHWAVVNPDGTVLGDEQSTVVPDHSAGPWFAAGGLASARDQVVIAFVPPLPPGPAPIEVDLMTFSVAIDGTNPTVPVSSGKIAARSNVAMMSGRSGRNVGVAWALNGTSVIKGRILDGGGTPRGSDLSFDSVADVGCLRFSGGKGDLTLGYVDLGTPGAPVFVGVELDAEGAPGTPFRLAVGKETPGCVELVGSSGKNYGVAWRSAIGSSFAVYDPGSRTLPSVLVVSEVRVSAGLAGLGWFGTQYGLLLTRSPGAEVWPVDGMGNRRGTLPALPSRVGHIGRVASQAVGTALYVTYADYDSAATQNVSSGARLLVKVSCPNPL